jgi:hypothetical protein
MMLLAAGWTWPAVVVVTVMIASFTIMAVATMASRFARHAPSGPAIGTTRLKAIEEDLEGIRDDLAEIKATLAELDRLFKSVG